jgi:hypothetical protein
LGIYNKGFGFLLKELEDAAFIDSSFKDAFSSLIIISGLLMFSVISSLGIAFLGNIK